MRNSGTPWVLAFGLGLAVSVAGCGAPPKADLDAAKAAVDKAMAASAGDYAADSLKAAQDAQAALDAELKAEDAKWFKSYDKVKEFAAKTRAAGEKAAADAVAGKEKARIEATAAVGEAKKQLAEAEGLLAKAPKGKGSAADIEAMKADLVAATTAITDAEGALATEHFLDAQAKAAAATKTATSVTSAVEMAQAAKKR